MAFDKKYIKDLPDGKVVALQINLDRSATIRCIKNGEVIRTTSVRPSVNDEATQYWFYKESKWFATTNRY